MTPKAPNKIIIPIEFDPMTDYYALEFPRVKNNFIPPSIQRISLEGIWRYLDEMLEPNDLPNYNVVFWSATRHGHTVKWRIPGDLFLAISETKVIDKMTRYEFCE